MAHFPVPSMLRGYDGHADPITNMMRMHCPSKFPPQTNGPGNLEDMVLATAGKFVIPMLAETFKDLATQSPSRSPLLALHKQVTTVFSKGLPGTVAMYNALWHAAGRNTTQACHERDYYKPESHEDTVTLVTLFACPKDRLHDARAFQRESLGGAPTLENVRDEQIPSFGAAYRAAKGAARGEKHITTVMAVSLVDVHSMELAARGDSETYTSFGHSFVLGIGPEGVIIWQKMNVYMHADESARVRTWEEAGNFVDWVDKLTQHMGTWDTKRNELYKKCFDVDMKSICAGSGEKPIVPQYEACLRFMLYEDVKAEDIHKFTFKYPGSEAFAEDPIDGENAEGDLGDSTGRAE
ncbi:hypothetical protein LTR56_021888 [Elasticomyces elasticus]|nr:hypothetical protein LTR56_021888 [Elasticomyces elasticus]KAK3630305.1 hypothetical protein LTR22_021567 [Elasticomyces elasticus]KAK4908975.1 hypothetical protein LTR49_022199 [Elasticomyces elasticus]KAK5754739.1 hypothetical protein LTS12_015150 [Elasticomyces elasticus]